jgi:N-methylhydantoinase B
MRPPRFGAPPCEPRAPPRVERLPSKVNNVRFAAGEAFIVATTGGGGIGSPGERERAAVLADLEAGRITARGAAADYGYEARGPIRTAGSKLTV